MDELAKALGPAFAAGFALQRLFELLDPVSERVVADAKAKKLLLSVLSLVAGIGLASWAGLRVLAPLAVTAPALADVLVTGLFITGGTEGFNSVMKFLGYKKEEQKVETGAKPKQDLDSGASLAAG